jgi:hypothetical protein
MSLYTLYVVDPDGNKTIIDSYADKQIAYKEQAERMMYYPIAYDVKITHVTEPNNSYNRLNSVLKRKRR